MGVTLMAAWVCLVAGSLQPAAAQGLFEALFGRHPSYVRPAPLLPQTSSYADPLSLNSREAPRYDSNSGIYTSHGTAFCVRTCDGRYFPLQHHAGASPAELCKSFCPASKTMVFSGGKIDSAVAANGTRYADLDNAFVYRDKVVDNCTCNGKDGLGLARVSAMTDPTLRPGDIVATNEGLVNFRGRASKTAEFTPIDASRGAWAQKLSEIKVRPAPPSQKIEVAPVEDKEANIRRKDRRRAQFR
jgi:hypothetical protein